MTGGRKGRSYTDGLAKCSCAPAVDMHGLEFAR
jgi:hypothetical protein